MQAVQAVQAVQAAQAAVCREVLIHNTLVMFPEIILVSTPATIVVGRG